MEELQRKAKALITFFGMVQFRMPLDTHSRCVRCFSVWYLLTDVVCRLIKMQVWMNS